MSGQVLVADGVATSRILLRVILSGAHYAVSLAANSATGRRLVAEAPPKFIILGDALEDGPSDAFLAELRGHPDTRNIPVIRLSDRVNTRLRVKALLAGADELMRKPVRENMLLARMRSLIRARETADALDQHERNVHDLGFAEARLTFTPPAHMVAIAQDRIRADAWANLAKGKLRHTIVALDRNEVLAQSELGAVADVYLIEAPADAAQTGLRLLAELRARPNTRHSAIIMVHERGDADTAVTALDLGANDLLELGFQADELALRLQIQLDRKRDADTLRASVAEGLRLAVLDPLTGLYNRRYAMAHANRLSARAAAKGREYGVVLLDIDRFKCINDTHGHATGDAVLVEIADRMRNNLRAVDMVARIGGEEFLVMMPEASPEDVLATAQRLCDCMRGQPIPVPGHTRHLSVTVSVGVAMGAAGERPEAVIDRADGALYAAKNAGRNTVTFSNAHAA